MTSREVWRDGPWRVEILGENEDKVEVALRGASARVGKSCPTPTGWQTNAPSDPSKSARSGSTPRTSPTACRPASCRFDDAGLAFGTGTHATTRGCLRLLLATLDPGETVSSVDVGSGSGILAIAMAKLWRRPVLGGGSNRETVTVARGVHPGLNGVGDLCRFVHAAGLRARELEERAAPFDLVVANILAGPFTDLAGSFAARRRPRAVERSPGRAGGARSRRLCPARFRPLERRIDLETGGAWWHTLLLREL